MSLIEKGRMDINVSIRQAANMPLILKADISIDILLQIRLKLSMVEAASTMKVCLKKRCICV